MGMYVQLHLLFPDSCRAHAAWHSSVSCVFPDFPSCLYMPSSFPSLGFSLQVRSDLFFSPPLVLWYACVIGSGWTSPSRSVYPLILWPSPHFVNTKHGSSWRRNPKLSDCRSKSVYKRILVWTKHPLPEFKANWPHPDKIPCLWVSSLNPRTSCEIRFLLKLGDQ